MLYRTLLHGIVAGAYAETEFLVSLHFPESDFPSECPYSAGGKFGDDLPVTAWPSVALVMRTWHDICPTQFFRVYGLSA